MFKTKNPQVRSASTCYHKDSKLAVRCWKYVRWGTERNTFYVLICSRTRLWLFKVRELRGADRHLPLAFEARWLDCVTTFPLFSPRLQNSGLKAKPLVMADHRSPSMGIIRNFETTLLKGPIDRFHGRKIMKLKMVNSWLKRLKAPAQKFSGQFDFRTETKWLGNKRTNTTCTTQ